MTPRLRTILTIGLAAVLLLVWWSPVAPEPETERAYVTALHARIRYLDSVRVANDSAKAREDRALRLTRRSLDSLRRTNAVLAALALQPVAPDTPTVLRPGFLVIDTDTVVTLDSAIAAITAVQARGDTAVGRCLAQLNPDDTASAVGRCRVRADGLAASLDSARRQLRQDSINRADAAKRERSFWHRAKVVSERVGLFLLGHLTARR